MTEQQESEFLRKLRVIQDADMGGVYADAKASVERQLAKIPGRTAFTVCDGASTETRRYVVECFRRDGLDAKLEDYESWNCGDTRQVSCVSVTIPSRRQGV